MTGSARDDAFDRDLQAFLAAAARDVRGAPSAADVAASIGARLAPRGARLGFDRSRLAWIALAGLLAVALGAALVAGLRPPPLPASVTYEAVFLRNVPGVPPANETVVIAVDADGHERELLRLQNEVGGGGVFERAQLSPSGLLLLRRHAGETGCCFRYEVVDLSRSMVPALVVADLEQPYYPPDQAWWGPRDQLALLLSTFSYQTGKTTNSRIVFVDGPTGSVTRPPSAVPPALRPADRVMAWAADGTGFIVGVAGQDMSVLLPSGERVTAQATIFDDGRGRPFNANGEPLRVRLNGTYWLDPSGTWQALPQPMRGLAFSWTADGRGVWVLASGAGRMELIRHAPGATADRYELPFVVPNAGWEPVARFLGLAPGDAALAVEITWSKVIQDPPLPAPDSGLWVVRPGSTSVARLDGVLAGWLAVPD